MDVLNLVASTLERGIDAHALELHAEVEGVVQRGEGGAIVKGYEVVLVDDPSVVAAANTADERTIHVDLVVDDTPQVGFVAPEDAVHVRVGDVSAEIASPGVARHAAGRRPEERPGRAAAAGCRQGAVALAEKIKVLSGLSDIR